LAIALASGTYPGQGSATSGVMDYVCDDALDVAVTLSSVELAVLGSSLAVSVVRLEHATSAFTLTADDATHLRKRNWAVNTHICQRKNFSFVDQNTLQELIS
jgi:hypothetical protein